MQWRAVRVAVQFQVCLPADPLHPPHLPTAPLIIVVTGTTVASLVNESCLNLDSLFTCHICMQWTVRQYNLTYLALACREFKLSEDMYAHDSIDLLKDSGIDFARNEAQGIDVQRFGELLISSGIVLNDEVIL